MNAQNYTHEDSENLVSQLWSKYFPYWPVFIALMILSLSGAWLFTRYKVPVYESTATLLIKDERKGIEDSKILESLNPLAGKKTIENEVEVIKSRALLGRVVNELALYAPVFEKGKWKDLSAYTTSPIKIDVQDPNSLVEIKKVSFKYNNKSGNIEISGKAYPLNAWVNPPFGTIRFRENNKNYRYKAPLYFSLINPKRVVGNLSKDIDISLAGKLSSVIVLKVKDEVPRRSEDILNSLISAYESAAVSDKNTLASNTLSFLDDRLKYVSGGLDSIEKALQQYKSQKGAIDISAQGNLFLQNVSENDQKLSDVNMKLAVLNQVAQYVTSKNSQNGIVPSTLGIDDPLLTNLLTKLYDSELQYEKLKLSMGENNPETKSVADQIQKIRPSILENIRVQQQNLTANKNNLNSTNGAYNSLLQALPKQERDLVEISREQSIKSTIYSFLLQKREETALSYSSTVSDTRVVDRAESSIEPVGLGNRMIYGVAAILALCLGIAIITARELFNKTILFRSEIEGITAFPVIGEISMEKKKSPLVLTTGKNTLIAEEFRMLRTSLRYLGINGNKKRLLVTSTISGEGKSFVTVNLGHSLALTGKKILLIEFDLSNPTLGDKLGMEKQKGLADYLQGDVKLEEIIYETTTDANLFIVPAGNLPQNPSELILSLKTEELLNTLEPMFDYILIDSAPVGLLSDGYVLSNHCDATLYVVRHGHTPKKLLKRLEHNNSINELKNIALVFNGVRQRGFIKDSYGYGYSSGAYYNLPKKKSTRLIKG